MKIRQKTGKIVPVFLAGIKLYVCFGVKVSTRFVNRYGTASTFISGYKLP